VWSSSRKTKPKDPAFVSSKANEPRKPRGGEGAGNQSRTPTWKKLQNEPNFGRVTAFNGPGQLGLRSSSPLPVCVVDDQELINDVLDPLGRIDGAQLCLNVLEFLG
jgi:hypothetical protein